VELGWFINELWSSGPILVASSFRKRWKGLRPRPAATGMLFSGRSVHGFGMKEPVLAIGLDALQEVTEVRILRPGRIVTMTRARQIMELPIGSKPPPVGVVLTWVDGGSGPADFVRNTDRQSG